MRNPTQCRFCGEEIYGGTVGYWHYWDLNTRNFLCTSITTINHPFHPVAEKKRGIWSNLWNFVTNL